MNYATAMAKLENLYQDILGAKWKVEHIMAHRHLQDSTFVADLNEASGCSSLAARKLNILIGMTEAK